jgi:preprotein translocase subunit SecG
MFGFLLVLMIVVAILLVVIILLQSGKGGGLAAEFGGASSSTESFIGGRQAANLLTRLSWIGGGVFMALALILSVLSSRSVGAPESILRGEFGAQVPAAPASVLETEATGGQPVEGGQPAGGGGADAGEPAGAPEGTPPQGGD